jgi:hypothetical protein
MVEREVCGFGADVCVIEQEWEVHRYQRRLYCLDDFKPTPPWHLIDNDYMKMHYDTKRPNQYSYDFAKFKVCFRE